MKLKVQSKKASISAADSPSTRYLLKRAVETLNIDEVLAILHEEDSVEDLKGSNILVSLSSWFPSLKDDSKMLQLQNVSFTMADELVYSLEEKNHDIRRDISYAIIDFCRDLSPDYDKWCEEMGRSLIEAGANGDYILVDTLMHSGADLFHTIQSRDDSMAVWDIIMMADPSIEITMALDPLFPGFPKIVRSCTSLEKVRSTLRMWVYPPPLSVCTPFVHGEIEHHAMTIKMIHAIYANNLSKFKQILSSHSRTVDVNARAVDRVNGPTILWYVVEKRQTEFARLLVSHGARVDLTVTVDSNVVPVLYAALTDSNVDVEMMKALLQQSSDDFSPASRRRFQELLYRMLFDGKNILERALESSLNVECFRVLLKAVGAKAIADRNSQGKTIRDIAQSRTQTKKYVEIIDECVIDMIQDTEGVDRKILALFGYDITIINMQQPPVDDFYSLYGKYQEWIRNVCRSIDKNDLARFNELLEYSGEGDFERLITWEGREGSANPLPMLHRAVIFNRKEMVEAILSLKPPGYSIDSLLDHQRRTALHYAYLKSDYNEIRDILRMHGCSEKVKDRNGYEPLDFKQCQDRSCVNRLIGQLQFGDFSSFEPGLPKRKMKTPGTAATAAAVTGQMFDDTASQGEDSDGEESTASSDPENWLEDEDDIPANDLLEIDACSIM